MKNDLPKKMLLGVGVTDASKESILEFVENFVQKDKRKFYIVTPNPEILVYANGHKSFKNILNNAKISLADGVGILAASKILGNSLKERFAGTDFVEKLCKRVAKKPITVGFLGGKGKVAELAAECLVAKCPGLKVGFVGENQDKLLKSPKSLSDIDILFVAFGFPKQEFWMEENIDKLPVRVMVGVGGALDYISGSVPRAPGFVRAIGLEWLFRLAVQPWRIKRQLALLEFIFLVLKERLKSF